MIFYFTGTGNSLWAARKLGKRLNEPLRPIDKWGKKEYVYTLQPTEKLLFVFPIHSWGLPVLMLRFIEKLKVEGYINQMIYMVCTCGDDCGNTDKVLQKMLSKKGLDLHGAFSVRMPNTYILLPGFDVDKKSLEEEKLIEAERRIQEIGDMILGERPVKKLYTSGSFACLKTNMVYPLFARFFIGKTSFYATDKCTACGLCARICPTGTISLEEQRPRWGNDCVQCLACIHRCPVRAIEYGKQTQQKGRYHHPGLKTK